MSTALAFRKLAEPLAQLIDADEDIRDLVCAAWNQLPEHEQEAYRKVADRHPDVFLRPGLPGQPQIVECYVCGRLGTNGGHGDFEDDKFTSAEQLAHYAQAMANGT